MSQEENQSINSISFYQIITVIIILIVAVIIKASDKEFYEDLRLKYANIIGDKGGYNEIVYPTEDIE